ncbi:HAD family hydrolase [Undibacterium pigrum]|uniref:HAD superfamily hydrolase (TIGR01509 family) n=1 Tax=Undibacterium pigrum TaxID=401470 RepID=A0A318JRS4_9BURK|nr:HAD family hydrolase [Undibacterium pigrum]PXX43042.1 HAD superfamily hydrolase (TIGR01509 family) [Undibacterium pigrum]
MPLPYQLIIFDCDGVLVDSERITNTVFVKMLNELGLPLKLEDMFEQFVGHSMEQCMSKITAMLGQEPPAEFLADYRLRTKAALENELVVVVGIPEVLAQLTLPYCVASSGDHEKMRTTLGVTGLWSKFEGRIFSVTDVNAPKPAPDVFLHAAATMGFAPADCVVVEDTPTGVRAALAAGMTVLAYAALTPAQRLRDAGAHIIFGDMLELPALLAGGKPDRIAS